MTAIGYSLLGLNLLSLASRPHLPRIGISIQLESGFGAAAKFFSTLRSGHAKTSSPKSSRQDPLRQRKTGAGNISRSESDPPFPELQKRQLRARDR
jgi:hypothetical protein